MGSQVSEVEQVAPRAGLFSSTSTALILGALTIVGAVLRLHWLAVRSLWIDEAASVRFATLPMRAFVRTLWGYQGNMALYYVVLREWIHLGDSEFMVRALSVLMGVLTIPAIYYLGKQLFDRPTGLAAAALLSVHSFHIHWSQETRAYTLLILLLVLATSFLVSAMETTKLRYWLAFTVTAALCVYAHVFAVLVLTGHVIGIVFPGPFQRIKLWVAVAMAILFEHLCAPMALFILLHHSDQITWIPRPTLADIYVFLTLLTSQGGLALVLLYFALCGLAFLQPDGEMRSQKDNWSLRLLVLWLVLPPLVTLLAGVVAKPLFYPRYMLMCVPAMVILAGRGIVLLSRLRIAKYWVAAPVLVVVLSLSAWGTSQYFRDFPHETSDWRSAVSYILERQQAGDGIVFFIPNTFAYTYYTHRAAVDHQITMSPEALYPPEPWRPLTQAELDSDIAGRKRIWLVRHIEEMDPAQAQLVRSTVARGRQLQEQKLFPGEDLITVELFSPEPAAH